MGKKCSNSSEQKVRTNCKSNFFVFWKMFDCDPSFNSSVGLYIAGKILVNAAFVTLDIHFNLEKEPKLNLNTDVDFSSENILCMQLSQPNDVFRYICIVFKFISNTHAFSFLQI